MSVVQEYSTSPSKADLRILISGASFAGLATAFWMKKLGYRVKIVEIAEKMKKGGTPVDIKEGTIDVVRRMGLLDTIRAKGLPPRRTEFKNADDITEASLPAQPIVCDGPDEYHEIERNELLEIMYAAVANDVDIAFGCSIVRLEEGGDGITAWFSDDSSETFAFVFGCDGVRSNTRRLIFGSEDEGMYFLGKYTFLKVVPKKFIEANLTQIFNAPGVNVMLNGYENKTDVVFGFRSEQPISYDYRDKAQQVAIVRERFKGICWRTPELLAEINTESEFYFDGLYQIRVPAWSSGRVALVGDAGYCPSPWAGMGGSMAILGAAALADAFKLHPKDHVAAFRHYDSSLRPFVEKVQKEAVEFGQGVLVPVTEEDIAKRNRKLTEA